MSQPARIKKAVIPAAGLGTRFLPATKSVPKEMLPIVDRPAIQYVIEEAAAAGITDILVITAPSKKTLEDHFDRDFELESLLLERNKPKLHEMVTKIPSLANIHFIRQGQPLGLGHAIGMAESFIGNESFAVLLPDDILVDNGELLKTMIELHNKTQSAVIAAGHYPLEEVISYGVIEPESIEDGVITAKSIVEKPPIEEAKSNYGIAPGRYVFPASIFAEIKATTPGAGGEIQLTDAIDATLKTAGVQAVINTSTRYDAGKKLDWLRATVELGLSHPELGTGFEAVLKDIIQKHGLAD